MNEQALRFPKAVEPGAVIGVVAPSFPVKPEEKIKLVEYLEKAGYKVKLGKTVDQLMNFHSYLAGDARTRAEDINQMFADPEVEAIICARGGYGSSHTMEYLDLDVIRANPKVFIGYSDITNFHSILNKYCDLVTFHGPMLISNMLKGFDEYSRKSLEDTLHMKSEVEFKNPADDPMVVLHPGTARGRMAGGNLSLLERSIGSFYQIDTRDKILLLEDVEEDIPCLDMMITHLEQAGMMKEINGLLLGNFSECTNDRYDASYTIEQFVQDRFADYKVPVIANVCSGHARPMGTIPMGTICMMQTDPVKIVFARQ